MAAAEKKIPDTLRVGLFQEMGYTSLGDPYRDRGTSCASQAGAFAHTTLTVPPNTSLTISSHLCSFV